MQKALVQMNVQLPLVVSDITGVTGLRILRDIVAGRTDPHALAQHRDYRCHASEAEIVAALTGNYRPEHVFGLRQNLDAFDHVQQLIAACDLAIEALLQTLAAHTARAATPLPAAGLDRSPATMNLASSSEPPSISSPASTSPSSMASAPPTPCSCSPRSGAT